MGGAYGWTPAAWAWAREAVEAAGGLVTAREAAALCGVSEQAISQRIARGAFPEPVRRVGRVRVFLRLEVEGFMARGGS